METKNDSFYINKSNTYIKPTINNIISITQSVTFDDYYHIYINYNLLNRFIKINKLTNSNKIKDILDLVYLCESYRKYFDDILEEALVNELSKEIDKDIIKNILKLKE